ncbi:hypothetical protein K2173_023588 [Erythroxylum novogranatense]|uniref:CASP-like protein n=1 Tax=Erythroxylum novogranatense TaxID=1862640 RepID=A0AAV8TRD9_9ROSI|nr:hypothetical protein K2173_023588 [Erythroxylum novogranatense]
MCVSHGSVHPVEDPPTTDGGINDNNDHQLAGLRMKYIQGMPGTKGGLALHFCQFLFSLASLGVMTTTSDFPSVTAFCYLVAATGLQCLWSISLVILDIYAILVMRSLQNNRIVSMFAVGDGIISTLTFAAACASAGITVLIDNDLGDCSQNHCAQFQTATAMAFISWDTF